MCGAVYKKNPTRAPPVKSVWIELPLFYSKTGFSASSSDRSAPAGGLTFLGAANIRSGFITLYHACEQGAGRFGKRSNLYGL